MNDQQRAAMQMALTTLEELKKNCTIWLESDDAAITALREALAQQDKPHVITVGSNWGGSHRYKCSACGDDFRTAHRATWHCENECVKALAQPPKVNEYGEELCEDEGCPHHGTPHICVSDPSVLADHSGDANEMVAEPAIPEWVDVDDYEEPVKQEPVAWHHPECKGECIACLIERCVKDSYGTQGLDFMLRHINAEPVDAKAIRAEECERICAAIKAEDDHCVDNGDYMLDSNDCIKIIRGKWVRPDYSLARAVISADRRKNRG